MIGDLEDGINGVVHSEARVEKLAAPQQAMGRPHTVRVKGSEAKRIWQNHG